MKISIIHTDGNESDAPTPFATFRDNKYATRFVKILRANSGKHIAEVIKTQAALPYFIDEPSDHLPDKLEPHDVLVCLNIHEELVLHLPLLAKASGGRAIIIPREDHDWITPWTMESVIRLCQDLGMDVAFPKPFCSLAFDEAYPVINKFIEEFRIGRPKVDVDIASGVVKRFDVKISAPCGDTYYVSKNMMERDIKDKLDWWIAKFWGAYPCIGSMKIDPETKDSVQHLAGHILLDEIHRNIREE